MDLGITGKWALVCGASKGLGRGCAEALVQEGVNVVINARHADALALTAADLIAMGADAARARGPNAPNPKVLTVAADITTEAGRDDVWNVAGGQGVTLTSSSPMPVARPLETFAIGTVTPGCARWMPTCSRPSR